MFQIFTRWGINMLKTLAWRSSTGSVSLTMTSDCNENNLQEFDFCFANDGNAKWYKDPSFSQVERNRKAFSGNLLGGKCTTRLCKDIEFHFAVLLDHLMMLNCSDHCLAWFILRMFSFTSLVTEATL